MKVDSLTLTEIKIVWFYENKIVLGLLILVFLLIWLNQSIHEIWNQVLKQLNKIKYDEFKFDFLACEFDFLACIQLIWNLFFFKHIHITAMHVLQD